MIGIGKNERVMEIPWENLILKEAIYLMANHDGNCWMDGDRRAVMLAN